MSDHTQLIKKCINGERAAQSRLYNLFSAKMYGVCLRYASDEMEAQDMLQEGFVKVYDNLKSYRFEGSFEGWIRRVIVNTSISYLRKQKKKFTSLEDATEQSIDPEIISEMQADDLVEVIRSLPNGFRTVFNMYAIEGYSHKEIASMLDISIGTSKSQYSRARKILIEKLKHNEILIDKKIKLNEK